MGGFLEGLTSLLGGFAAKDQIDKDGFDYQQIRDQKRLEREQEAQKFQQANEDWATKAATEQSLGGAEEQDIASTLSDKVNRASILARARGATMQSKSELGAQRAEREARIQELRNAGGLDIAKERGNTLQALLKAREEIRSRQDLSPRDKAMLEGQIDRLESQHRMRVEEKQASPGGAKGSRLVQTDQGWTWMTPPTEGSQTGGVIPTGAGLPQTAVERTRKEQAVHVMDQADSLIRELGDPKKKEMWENVAGPRTGLKTAFQDTTIGGFVTGGPPPEAGRLAAMTASLSAFLPILHGMRGGENMISHFEHILGKKGELALTRPIETIMAAAQALGEAARRIHESGDTADLSDILPRFGGSAVPAGGKKRKRYNMETGSLE